MTLSETSSGGTYSTNNGTNSTGPYKAKNGNNSTRTYSGNSGTNSTKISLSRKSINWETHCDNMCNKTDYYYKCCGSAWRFLDDSNPIKIELPKSNILKFPRVHGVILIVLSSLFLLSILEGLLELCVPFMPYRLLYSYTPIRFQQNQ